jgi:hypothetical protein
MAGARRLAAETNGDVDAPGARDLLRAATEAAGAHSASGCPDVLYTVRKLTFRGEDTTRANIAKALNTPAIDVTEQLRRAYTAGLIRPTKRASGADWSLTEAGERALSAHLLQLRDSHRRPRPRS